jgi:hypothetical protein
MQCASARDIVAPGWAAHVTTFPSRLLQPAGETNGPSASSSSGPSRMLSGSRISRLPITRTLLKPRLVRVVEAVLRTTEVVREAAEGCASLVGQLSAGNHEAEESQRPQAPVCRIEHSAAPDIVSLYGRIPRV